MTSRTANRRTARWYAQQINNASSQAAATAELAEHAERLGLEYEAERLNATAVELDGEVADLMVAALEAGYSPAEIGA